MTATAAHADPAPKLVHGADLALRWPELIGQTIQVRATPVQALDVVRFHVKIDSTDAVMIIAPGKVWSGARQVCAMVTGPEKMHKQGRTQLIGLMWQECGK
jgi:hypothetical protein